MSNDFLKSEQPNDYVQLCDVYKYFHQGGNNLHVLRGITESFTVGNTYALSGASGSGKSTLLHILGGLERPSQGTVSWNEKNIFSMSQEDRRSLLRSYVGFVFQFHYLIHELTVCENVMLPGQIIGEHTSVCRARAYELLECVGLKKRADVYPYQLSGGEQQRVAVVRALCNKPRFILADEPTGNLDAEGAKALVDLLLQCHKQWGLGMIVCSHDMNVCKRMNQHFVLHDGHLKTLQNR